ncbi:MAG TPA: sodium pump decarboxylase subunit gamma [Lachnoclostridium sp.]|uniref:Sodium pump decarboxylase gamma subunit n=1 Tax=[Clostridium] celerecrescens 18A TaxID=1286362 RepID=A0A2M8Z6A2_9FIRM|nr:OadG family protein [Lacrimispora celerecrescens]PJJ28986.1 sodium pump decarboxylase gamma subunit [[Clostridium] celerecrescens 18A]HBE86896.1 sodium pump decarboxylase subunit gamma [Lachnoclostridium sp.]
MKLNMKRVALGLIMAACLFSLSACSKADTAAEEIDARVQTQMEQLPGSFLELYTGLEDSQVPEFKKNMQYQDEYAALAEGVDSWENVKHELGALVSIGDTVKVEAIGHGYSATINAVFEKRNMEFSITTDSKLTKVTSVAFVPEYTLGERMEKAVFNTLMGMGTVFIVLIFISCLIGCFQYIGKLEDKINGKAQEPVPAPIPEVSVPAAEENEELVDDLELVAVITAAIAASEGSSPSGLVVRSIRRAPSGKWKKA